MPCICVWMAQWYRNVPALLNSRLNEAPGAIEPEFHTPVFEVEVWRVLEAFVHRTLVPRVILILAGSKA